MKFSDKTLTVLKNFASINPSLLFKPGQQLRTISPQKTVVAIATIDDVIPAPACVYDISRFLSVYGLYSDPDIVFEDKNFIIAQGKQRTKYVFADPSMVIAPPDKDIKLATEDVKVKVQWNDLQTVIKASGVLQLPEIAFQGADGVCTLRAVDSSNPTADTFGIELGATTDTFQMIIKTEYFKMIPNDYHVTLSSKGISLFEAPDIRYYLAIESKSTYRKGE